MSDTEPADVPMTSRINFGAVKAPVEQAEETVQAEAFEAQAEAEPEATVETEVPASEPFTNDELVYNSDESTQPVNAPAGDQYVSADQPDERPVVDVTAPNLAVEVEAPIGLDGPFTEPTTDGGEVFTKNAVIAEEAIVEPAADEADAVDETAAKLAPSTQYEMGETQELASQTLTDAPVIETPEPSSGPSVEEMQSERDRLDAEINKRVSDEKAAVIDQIKTVVQSYGITPEELVEALGGFKSKRKGAKAKTKYKDPVSGAVWSGRGKSPAWIVGKNFADFLIPEDQRV